MEIRFIEQSTLKTRSGVSSEPDIEVKTFLRSDVSVLRWESGHNVAGYDVNNLFPAWVKGKRAFMLRRSWRALSPYNAEGTQEDLLTFKEGVKILIEQGVYDFAAPKKAQK
jgi:hypothetical protein